MTTPTQSLVTLTSAAKKLHPLCCPEFGQEKPDARAQVLERWALMESIAGAPRTLEAIAACAASMGIPYPKLKRLYYAWINPSRHGIRNDWRVLVNRSKYPVPRVGTLSPAFITFVKNLHERHQRDTTGRRVRDLLMQMLAAWELDPLNPDLFIPGYDAPPKRLHLQGHPPGWSLSQIYRMRPDKYERTLRRQGPKAASNYLPSLYTTRVGLEFGAIYYFDDQQYDNKINLTGVNNKEMRPLGFNAVEALSASTFEMALKPQIWKADERKKSELNADEFFWFLALVLTKHGYRADIGTTLVYEHGTANPDKTGRFAERLHEYTGGKVTVNMSGLWHAPAFKAMLFEGRSTGNFRHKALCEGSFNFARNFQSALPAPTGLNRDAAPEENYGLEHYNEAIRKLRLSLPQEFAEGLCSPIPEWEIWTRWARNINDIIELHQDHNLEGWSKIPGFTSKRYRLSADSNHWIDERDYLSIPATERVALDHIVTRPGYFQSYKLSRREVFNKFRAKLTKLPLHAIPLLAPDRMWEKVTVGDDLELQIKRPLIDSEPLRYIAKCLDEKGHETFLRRKESYHVLINPFDSTYIWVRDLSGRYIGVATQTYIPCDIDIGGIYNQMGELGHIKSLQSKEVHTRMEGTAESRQRMVARNKAIVAKAKEAEAGKRDTKAAKKVDAAYAATPAPAATETTTPTTTRNEADSLFH